MARTVPVEVRVAGLPQMARLLTSVSALLGTLDQAGDLPEPVMTAVAQLHHDVAAFAGSRPMPDDGLSGEDRARDTMAKSAP